MDKKLCIFRKGMMSSHFIFSLTENWSLNTEARDWGLEPIWERLNFIDSWNRDLVAQIREADEKKKKAKDRQLDNHMEAYLKEHRRDFAKATNDVLTHSLKKTDKRRLKEN